MKIVKTYSNRVEADIAKIALDAEGIPCFVLGIGVAMEGGMEGVQLQVPDDHVESALKILEGL